jgi:peptidoglycan/xylan/chitin deacetylase (PgdA/CDA1 family)
LLVGYPGRVRCRGGRLAGANQLDLEPSAERHAAFAGIARKRCGAAAIVLAALLAPLAGCGAGSRPASSPAHGASQGAAGAPAETTARAPAGAPGRAPVPILMYHVIAPPPAGAPFPGLYVLPDEFAAQMRALKGAGWHAVTMDQLAAYWNRGEPLGAGKPVVLTFDNGYRSQYTEALPVLRELGWVGTENMQLSGLPPSQGGLTSEQVRGLISAGWELDTQGYSHADLIRLTPEELRFQVAVTRRTLQQRFGVPVNWFCYPSGHYDATVIAAVKAAGYAGSTTVIPGWAAPAEDRYRLHRLRVLGGTSPQELLALIASSRADGAAPASYGGA